MKQETLRKILRLLFKYLCRLEIRGLDHIPAKGACILAVNHVSLLDAALVFAILDRRDVTALVADKYKKNPFIHWLVNAANGIWINREQADLRALRATLEWLSAGGILGIAPEGTRSHSGGLLPAKAGVAYIVDKASAPVIPVGVFGTENAISALLRLSRPVIHLNFGNAFNLPPLERSDREASMQRNTDEIMRQIASLLPPSYRGVYAGNHNQEP